MSNVQRLRKTDRAQMTRYPVNAATVIEVGDLLYMEVDDVRPASDLTYGATLAATQAQFAKQFVGVAMEASQSGEDNDITVAKAGIFEFPCAAATFEIGDLVGPDDNAGPTALLDQQVIAMGESGIGSIGRVAKRYASNTTTVLIKITPRDMVPDQLIPIPIFQGLHTTAADLVTDWPVPFPFKLVRLDAITTVLSADPAIIAVHKGATALDDTLTIADATAVGGVDSVAMDDATGDDIFNMGDTLSLVSNGGSSAGEALFILWVAPYRNES